MGVVHARLNLGERRAHFVIDRRAARAQRRTKTNQNTQKTPEKQASFHRDIYTRNYEGSPVTAIGSPFGYARGRTAGRPRSLPYIEAHRGLEIRQTERPAHVVVTSKSGPQQTTAARKKTRHHGAPLRGATELRDSPEKRPTRPRSCLSPRRPSGNRTRSTRATPAEDAAKRKKESRDEMFKEVAETNKLPHHRAGPQETKRQQRTARLPSEAGNSLEEMKTRNRGFPEERPPLTVSRPFSNLLLILFTEKFRLVWATPPGGYPLADQDRRYK